MRGMQRPLLRGLVLALALGLVPGVVPAQLIEDELVLITPVSKFIHDAALKAFAQYAKETWNLTVKVNALAAGTPVTYGRIVEWKGRPEADILGGWETMTVGIFTFYIAGSANEAAALSFILIIVAALSLALVNRIAGARLGGVFG